MADYTGQGLYAAWIYSGGTVVLSGDYKSFSDNPSVGLADSTAGADTDRTYIPTVRDATIDFAALHQSGGTVLKQSLREGTQGTLILAPEGTIAGKPKETYPAISMGAKMNYPFDNVVEIAVTFQRNGAAVYSSY